MHPSLHEPGRGGLFRSLVLPFSLFVLGASLALIAWLQGVNRMKALRDFENTARENARFVEKLRLPRSPELARNLSEVLGVGVGFYHANGAVAGLPPELLPIVAQMAGPEARSSRSGEWDLAIAPITGEESHLLLLRKTSPFFSGPASWLLPTLIVTSLGGGIAALVARRIVMPLSALTRWLPNLEGDTIGSLPVAVTNRSDEIGTLARTLEENHRRLVDETKRRQQSERLAALGRIATSLAHEIRNPAAAIRMHADLLATGATPDSHDSLELIREEVDRITDLVNQWLYVARSTPPRMEGHDLVFLVNRVARRLAPQFDHAQVSFSLEAPETVTILADAPRLEQVVRNLLLNAMQAMPGGGSIRASIQTEETAVSLFIRDEGDGFTEEALARWSEPFFSEREGGMGLGLTLAAEVISGHGAEIAISNDSNGGGEVRCRFPIVDPQSS